MTHTNSTLISIARRLRPRAEDFAAAAARRTPTCCCSWASRRRAASGRPTRPPWRHDERAAAVGERRRPTRGGVGGQDRAHGDLEGAGGRAADGAAAQHRRRRPGRPARARRRAPRGVRLPDRVLPLLGARARPRRLHLRAVRRELHRRRARRRRGLHRRPLPHRRGAVRGHPAARDVLPRRHPDGRAGDAVAAGRPPPPGLLPARARGGRGGGRRRDRQGRRRARAADGRRGRRAALPARTSRARCSSARCACRRSARAGRGASASCSPRPTARRRAPAWPGFRPLRVAEIRRESATRDLVPARAGRRRPRPRRRPGQYLTVRCGRTPTAPPLVRSYSLSDLPRARLPDQRQARGRRPAATCTSTSRSATWSTWPRRAAPSSCATGTARSC